MPDEVDTRERGVDRELYDSFPHLARIAANPRGRRLSRHLPLHLWYALRAEWPMLRLHWRAARVRRAFRGLADLKVNIAPGAHPFPGWVNIDVFPGAGIDYQYDCRKDLPFETGSVRAIYTEHFVEHLEYSHEAQVFFSECARVIAPGGRVRIVVPDGGAFLKAYASGDRQALHRLTGGEPWFDGKWETPMELVNLVFRQGHEHHFAYDAETLCGLLERYGFSAEAMAFNVSSIPGFVSDEPTRQAYSLYVEALRLPAG